jgi:hypothetical protein
MLFFHKNHGFSKDTNSGLFPCFHILTGWQLRWARRISSRKSGKEKTLEIILLGVLAIAAQVITLKMGASYLVLNPKELFLFSFADFLNCQIPRSRQMYRALLLAAFVFLLPTNPTFAVLYFDQGFEANTDGWLTGGGTYGTVTRVASGTGGVPSKSGGYHAEFTQDASGPYTFYNDSAPDDAWLGGHVVSLDVYLDTNWSAGEGFDYSAAINDTSGNHRRDFIFHTTQDTSTGQLLVSGSNNTNFNPREDLETLNHYVVSATGWYTYEHMFYEKDGALAVDLNLRNADGDLLFTETRTDASDLIGGIGGPAYSWFTNIDIAGGIEVDNGLLFTPEPGSLLLFGVGMIGAVLYRRRKAQLHRSA